MKTDMAEHQGFERERFLPSWKVTLFLYIKIKSWLIRVAGY